MIFKKKEIKKDDEIHAEIKGFVDLNFTII